MFERFTDRARRVVVQAQEESRRLNHSYIGTEHLLLGILREDEGVEDEGVAAAALASLEVGLDPAREQVAEIVGRGQQAPSGHIPFTPRAKKVLELSLRESVRLGYPYIGPEHILLGLITEGHGVAVEVLRVLGAPPEQVQARVLELVPPAGEDPAGPSGTGPPVRVIRGPAQLDEVLRRLDAIDTRLAAIERRLGLGEPPAAAGPG
jgi:ATP-dependent Clp protease ATP-binding subunit ClpC